MQLIILVLQTSGKMEYTELIQRRESVRNYDPDRPVPAEVLERILEAGRIAPSAANYQPWRFLVISSSGLLEKVKASYAREWFRNAPHVLVIVGSRDKAWKRSSDGYNSIETDLAIALTHMILAAWNEGVGTCWIANYNPSVLYDAIKPAEGEVIFGITPLGYPGKGYQNNPEKRRKPFSEIAEFL
jgi:nitroreductase